MSQGDHDRAYRTLDGLRGVAALMVVTRHIGDLLPGDLFPESFLAVDLFFLLSGFVVAFAYEGRLLAGRSLGAFMKTRLIRLYPLYALGIGLGAVAHVTANRVTGAPFDAGFLATAGVIGLLMLPAIPPLPMGSSALDAPTWTLAPELLVNLVYAALVKRLSRVWLWAVIGAGAIGLVVSELAYGTLDGGWSVDRFPLLAARLAFSFFLGVAMCRARPSRRVGAMAAWACLAGLALALGLRPAPAWRPVYQLFAVLLVFPGLVSVAIRHEPGRAGGAVFSLLGLVSYAVYVLHQPLGVLAGLALRALPGSPPPVDVTVPLFMLAVVGLCVAIDTLYDRPVRRALTRLRPARALPASTGLRPGDA